MALDLETRLRAVEDELAIRALAARFGDCVNQRDFWGFAELWSARAIWDIGPPMPGRAEGVDAIVAMLQRRLQLRLGLMPSPRFGVLHITGDTARVRLSGHRILIEDEMLREACGRWRFARRVCRHRYFETPGFADLTEWPATIVQV